MISKENIRKHIATRVENFGCKNPYEGHIDIDSMQLVELALQIEADYNIEFRDDLIPPDATLENFVDLVHKALQEVA